MGRPAAAKTSKRKPRPRRPAATPAAPAPRSGPGGLTLSAPERVPLGKLRPLAGNPRRHPEQNLADITGALREFGQTHALLALRDGSVLVGNGRLEAMRRMGWPDCEVRYVDGIDAKRARALAAADNRAAERSEWDPAALLAIVAEGELPAEMFSDEDLAGIERMLDDAEAELDGDEDVVPEPPAVPVTQPGDVWQLGAHRLVCGDSTLRLRLESLMGGDKADVVFTSPPYAVGIDYGPTYEDTIERLRAVLAVVPALWAECVADGGFAFVNFGDIISGQHVTESEEPCEYPMALEYWSPFRKAGWNLFTRRIWQKPHARVAAPWTASSCRAASDWEHLWVWKRPGRPLVGRSEFSALGVWDTTHGHGVDVGKDVFGAGMPVELVRRALLSHCRRGRIVLEPFCGTGTTIIGAEATGRVCRAVELAPASVDVSVLRWLSHEGRTAVHVETGLSYHALAAERGVPVGPAQPAGAG